ncbi:MAG TPA: SGNH/GDSL hydrolase family protein [Tepidisphaeraceae bacterium]|nr:SGNH/GDSL hydrolase family protein [Tepidisphaeraceae bacterium]
MNSTRRFWFTLSSALLLLPLVAHWVGMAWLMSGNSTHLEFSGFDFVVMTASFIYAVVVGALMVMRRSAAAKGIALIYSILLGGLLGEVSFRLLNSGAYRARAPWPQVSRVMEIDTSELPGLEPHVVVSVNSLGLRGPEVDLNTCDLKVLCVGGSTTECLYVTDKKTWPWLVQDELHRRLGTSVFVGNAGRAGQFSLHHEYQLRHYQAAHEFNWVILLLGANDVAAFLSEDYVKQAAKAPYEALTSGEEYPPVPAPYYRELRLVQAAAELQNVYSLYKATRSGEAIIQDMQAGWVRQRRAARHLLLTRYGAISEIPGGLDAAIQTYQDTIRRIIECCHKNGQHLVLMTQPSMLRSNLTEQEQALLCQAFENGAYDPATLAAVMDRYNAALLDVCRQDHVDCIDLGSMLPKDTSVFYDDVHFNVPGCDRVARIVADFVASKVTSRRS